jgi:hypothetical protein
VVLFFRPKPYRQKIQRVFRMSVCGKFSRSNGSIEYRLDA